jgi:hypothetical protein
MHAPNPSFSEPDEVLFTCPFCEKSLSIIRQGLGQVIQCPGCEKDIRVPRHAFDGAEQFPNRGSIQNVSMEALRVQLQNEHAQAQQAMERLRLELQQLDLALKNQRRLQVEGG